MRNIDRFTSLSEFAAWVSSLPADGSFNYTSVDSCVFANWAKACGNSQASGGGWSIQNGYEPVYQFVDIPWMAYLNDRFATAVVISVSALRSIIWSLPKELR